jgi:hypothetical protein
MRRVLIALAALMAILAGWAHAQPAPRVHANRIDELVGNRLKQLNVQPADLSSDAVFVRRVYLDVLGTLPTAAEARTFLNDKDPDKRSKLIARLLERDEFADYWALKWSDLLRVKSEFPINLWPNAVQAYHGWIRGSIRANLPYDQFARELLTESGSNFRVPQVNFYRAVQSREPRALAAAVALTFMGARADRWPAEQLNGVAAFFSQVGYKTTQEWKEEIVYYDANRSGPREAVFPDGKRVVLKQGEDPRVVFADWLITPENAWFTRAIANRVWSWLLGRGVIDEPDDIRADNPPSNPELLAYLEGELVAAHYDLKQLYRLILNSSTYQRSARGTATDFAHYIQRPLEAEVLIDAINQITGGSEQYSSAIPEPYTFIPEDRRSITLADASITSAFLKTFGRPARDLGTESERTQQPSAAERLALLNSSHVQSKIEQSAKLQALVRFSGGLRPLVANLYLTILSRPPEEQELNAAEAYAQKVNGNPRALVTDLAWALINTPEFLYRH